MPNFVNITDLSKNYLSVQPLKNINLNIEKNEIYGIIGPDGAGKSTLLRILATLILPDSGKITISGYNVVKDFLYLRCIIGYMPGKFSLYQDLSVEENLKFFATIFGTSVKENYQLIEGIYISLQPFKKRKAGKLSGGMKQKLALCCALIHKPELLILDEPTRGVDPVSRKDFWDILHRLKESGITIIVSTAYMDEAHLCDRVALLQKGELLTTNTPKGLIESFPKNIFSIFTPAKNDLFRFLRTYKHTESVFLYGEQIHYLDKRNHITSDDLINDFMEINSPEVKITRIIPDVEDCFMVLMQQEK